LKIFLALKARNVAFSSMITTILGWHLRIPRLQRFQKFVNPYLGRYPRLLHFAPLALRPGVFAHLILRLSREVKYHARPYLKFPGGSWSKGGVINDDGVQEKESDMLDHSSAEPGRFDLDQWTIPIHYDAREGSCVRGR
jgi:hypothetical protein